MRRAPCPSGLGRAAWIGFVAALLAPATVRADTPAPLSAEPAESAERAAARHFETALAHADQKEFALAILEFERAYELAPHPIVSYNLGLSHAALGQSSLALDAFERSLAERGTALDAERVVRIRELIDAQKAKLGRLELDVSPREARVGIDGANAAQVTRPVWLAPGPHRLAVSAPGHEPFAGEVTLRARETTRLEVSLTPLSPAPAELPEGAALPQALSGPPAHADAGDDSRFWAYVAGGSGLGLGGAALLSYLFANTRYSQWKDVRDVVAEQPASNLREGNQATMADLKSEVQTFDALAVAFGIGAGALLAGSAYLFLSAPSEAEGDGPSLGLSGSTLFVSGKF